MKGYGWEKPLIRQNPGLSTRLELTWGGSAAEEQPRCQQLPDTAAPPCRDTRDGGEPGAGTPQVTPCPLPSCPPSSHPQGLGSLGWTQLGWPWMKSWERQNHPLPSHSTARRVHRGPKAAEQRSKDTGLLEEISSGKGRQPERLGFIWTCKKNCREKAVSD